MNKNIILVVAAFVLLAGCSASLPVLGDEHQTALVVMTGNFRTRGTADIPEVHPIEYPVFFQEDKTERHEGKSYYDLNIVSELTPGTYYLHDVQFTGVGDVTLRYSRVVLTSEFPAPYNHIAVEVKAGGIYYLGHLEVEYNGNEYTFTPKKVSVVKDRKQEKEAWLTILSDRTMGKSPWRPIIKARLAELGVVFAAPQ